MEHIIGLGEYAVSNNIEDTIKTYALATCIGLVLYCSKENVMAMAHIVMPKADKNNHSNPARYANTVVPFLLRKMIYGYGCRKDRIVAHLFGGIEATAESNFRIGEMNLYIIRLMLDNEMIKYYAAETGGRYCRTITGSVESGDISVHKLPI